MVKLIQHLAWQYFHKKEERSDLKPYFPIVYLKIRAPESAIRRRIEIASSLDEINDILQSVDKQTLTVISKFTQRFNAFKRIKKLYNDTTDENSKSRYEKLCRTNVLTNLEPTSLAWEKCEI